MSDTYCSCFVIRTAGPSLSLSLSLLSPPFQDAFLRCGGAKATERVSVQIKKMEKREIRGTHVRSLFFLNKGKFTLVWSGLAWPSIKLASTNMCTRVFVWSRS